MSKQFSTPEQDSQDKTTWKEAPVLYLKGFFMGSADVVPGVSGGTMALIFGIYYRFVNAIKSVNIDVIKALFTFKIKDLFELVHWKFLLILLSGILSAVIFFTRVIPLPVLMQTNPELIYGLFFGLIAGSVLLLIWGLDKISFASAMLIVLGTAIGFAVVNLVPVETPDNMLFIFFSGSIAISAMVLPGISGSFILLILRKYDTVLGAFGKLGGSETIDALLILVPFGFGMLFGIGLFARVLSWLLSKYYVSTLCILIGFMAGSLYIIWPFQQQEFVDSVRTEVVYLQSERAQEVIQATPDTSASEYVMPGDIINPEATPDQQKIQLITVKKKQISSIPYVPDLAGTDLRLTNGRASVISGYGMMLAGLLLVFVIGYISRQKDESIV
jgi:putative membrane protein